jgi:PadR family transcriptional regulator PadR
MITLSPIEYEILSLLRSGKEMYGLEMVRSSKKLKRGTIYVTLDRMTDKGLVESRAEKAVNQSGMPRRQYKIKGYGQRVLHAHERYVAELGGLDGTVKGGLL